MKKIVISGYYGFNNFGDEIVLDSLIQALKAPDVDITVLSSSPELTAHDLEINAFSMFNLVDVIHQIFVSDVLISGGGSLFQCKTSIKSFLYYILIIIVGVLFKKKVVIFSQGFEPLANKYLNKILIGALSKVDYISVRDEKSYNYLSKSGLKVNKFADLAWNLPEIKVEKEDKVVVQLRDWHDFDDKKMSILANAVSGKFADKKVEVISLQDEIDLQVCKEFAEKLVLLDMDAKVVGDLSNEKVIEKISSAQYVIAMRYHACLVAAKFGVAAFCISYDDKVKHFAQEFELPYVEMKNFYRAVVKNNIDKLLEAKVNHSLVMMKQKQAKESVDDIIDIIQRLEVFD